jgi:hypothetical protein
VTEQDDFYVGYLKPARSLKRFVAGVVTVLLLLVLGIAVLIASAQRDPGDAVWELDMLTSVEGTIRYEPYPVLHPFDRTRKSLLLISEGKLAAPDGLRANEGAAVRLSGFILRREELYLLELSDEPVVKLTQEAQPVNEARLGERVTLRGEVIDPKCYAGAMKPGEGKPHKACAVLCLRGGIPPMFLDETGGLHLLVNGSGDALVGDELEQIVPFVGDRVELGATRARAGEFDQLRVDTGDVRRLTY